MLNGPNKNTEIAMETLLVEKGGDTILIERENLDAFEKRGYKVADTPPPPKKPVPKKLVVKPKSHLITIAKGDTVCRCEEDQLAGFVENGWKRIETKPDPAPSAVVNAAIDPSLIVLAKGNKRCACEESQVSALEQGGWKRVDETVADLQKPESDPKLESKPKLKSKRDEEDPEQ